MRTLPFLAVGVSLLAPLSAQDEIFYAQGTQPGDMFGTHIAALGDIDGDTVGDLAVSAPSDDAGGLDAGSVTVLSGADRSVLFRFDGVKDHDLLGGGLGCAGDVDGDGVTDLIIGAPQGGSPVATPGRAEVYSGADGALLLTLAGGSSQVDRFGGLVGGLGDVDGDGLADVYATQVDLFQLQVFVNVYSGASGALLYRIAGAPGDSRFARAIAVPGDLDDDGVADLLVADPDFFLSSPKTFGRVVAYSGATGKQRGAFFGDATTFEFALALSGAGDVDSDGRQDFLIGSSEGLLTRVQVVSGKTFKEFYTLHDPFPGTPFRSQFGRSLDKAGDVNGDGLADFVVGAFGCTPNTINGGSVFVYSGPTGDELFLVQGTNTNDKLGAAVAGVGDIDGDGLDDVAAGKLKSLPPMPGQVWGLGLSGDGSWFSYCSAKASSSGCLAQLSGSSTTSVGPVSGAGDFTVTMSGAEGQRPGILFASMTGLTTLPFFGGTMCMLPPLRREPALFTGGTAGACDGSFGVVVNDGNPFPPAGTGIDAGPGGTSWVQGWYRDRLLGDGFDVALSNAIQINWQ